MFGRGIAGLFPRIGMGGAIGRGINWMGLLNGAGRTIGFINQAIPLYNQVRPWFSNAKTMLKIAGSLNEPQTNKTNNTKNLDNKSELSKPTNSLNRPVFFL